MCIYMRLLDTLESLERKESCQVWPPIIFSNILYTFLVSLIYSIVSFIGINYNDSGLAVEVGMYYDYNMKK